MSTDIETQVIEIIAEQALLAPSDIAMSSTLDGLGIDSLGIVESIFAIEEAFNITIPFNANDPTGGDFDTSNIGTIIDAVKLLVEQ